MIRHKMVFLGKATVGKSSMVRRLTKDKFDDDSVSTVGAAFINYHINNREHNFDIWDTAGQERFMSITQMYYRGANIAIFVFDCSKLGTLKNLEYYIDKVKQINNSKVHVVVLGNKADMINPDEYENILGEARNKIKYYDPEFIVDDDKFLLVSARTSYNMDKFKDILVELSTTIKANKFNENSAIELNTYNSFYSSKGDGCLC